MKPHDPKFIIHAPKKLQYATTANCPDQDHLNIRLLRFSYYKRSKGSPGKPDILSSQLKHLLDFDKGCDKIHDEAPTKQMCFIFKSVTGDPFYR